MSSGLKRVLSSAILLPTVLAIFILGNEYVIDVFVAIVAARCIYELFNAFKQKGLHPVEPLGYIAAFAICFLHIIPKENILILIGAILAITILVSFILIILRKKKTDIIDVAITFFSIFYIVIFLIFVSLLSNNIENGKWLVWYIFLTSWMTDVFAYLVGRSIGKHHFTDISPKKTIEGCIGGILGAAISIIIYTVILNKCLNLNINYLVVIISGVCLSIISQIGDLAASTIKRYVGIKDFSNLIPGHGGMLDRIDSLIFVAPFVYFLFILI